jgi:hydroxylaminobenzene mutase
VDWVVHVGLVELALGGLLGWAMVLQERRPDLVKRAGVVAPRRIRQTHLDYVFMGLILIGVGLAVPSLSDWIAIPLVFGTIMNPFLFVPQAFSHEVEERLWYRALAIVSFLGVSGGLVAVAIAGPG